MRRTWICFSRLRAWAMSYDDCMRMSVSIFTPKAFWVISAVIVFQEHEPELSLQL